LLRGHGELTGEQAIVGTALLLTESSPRTTDCNVVLTKEGGCACLEMNMVVDGGEEVVGERRKIGLSASGRGSKLNLGRACDKICPQHQPSVLHTQSYKLSD
jgi:hypothetical protein